MGGVRISKPGSTINPLEALDSPLDGESVVKEVSNDLNLGKDAFDKGMDIFSSFTINGKTIQELHNQYCIPIPQDPTPNQLKQIAAQCGNFIQEVRTRMSLEKSFVEGVRLHREKKYRKNITSLSAYIHSKNKTFPQNAQLNTMAESNLTGDLEASNIALIRIMVWESILNNLVDVMKLITQMNTSNAHEVKLRE